jgi:hypothetical protein
MTNVNYENKTINVTENLPGKDFQPGTYFVNIFDTEIIERKQVLL